MRHHPHRRRRHQRLAEMMDEPDEGVQLPANAANVELATPQMNVHGTDGALLTQGDKGPTYDQLCGLSSTRRKIIGTTPAGQAALLAHDNASQAQKLHKLKGHPDPKVANAAATLHAAKKGDPRAKKKIELVHAAAQKGHPEGQAAMRRLNAVDHATRGSRRGPSHPGRVEHVFHMIADAFKHGGTRFAGDMNDKQ